MGIQRQREDRGDTFLLGLWISLSFLALKQTSRGLKSTLRWEKQTDKNNIKVREMCNRKKQEQWERLPWKKRRVVYCPYCTFRALAVGLFPNQDRLEGSHEWGHCASTALQREEAWSTSQLIRTLQPDLQIMTFSAKNFYEAFSFVFFFAGTVLLGINLAILLWWPWLSKVSCTLLMSEMSRRTWACVKPLTALAVIHECRGVRAQI